MTTYTSILNMPQVATNQNQKETTINTDLAILEAAFNDSQAIDTSGGDVVLTIDQYTKWFMQRCQGHTVSTNLDTPTLAGSFTGKRFFIVSNEGIDDIVVRPSGSGTGTITVPAAGIMLLQNDGTTIRAVSAGAALLTDLSDVDVTTIPPTNGQILKWNSGTSKWDAGNFSAGVFIALTDVPASYSGAAYKGVRVNAAANALEFSEVPCDLEYSLSGIPAGSQVINKVITRATRLVSTLTGSAFYIGTNPTALLTINIYQITAGVPNVRGSVAFDTAGVPTVTWVSNIDLAAGDVLQLSFPAVPDATGANFALTFKGQVR